MDNLHRKTRGGKKTEDIQRYKQGHIGVVERVFKNIQYAWDEGYGTVSAQGGTRSGKSYNIMIWCVLFAIKHKDIIIGITRKTSPTIYGTVYQDFVSVMNQLGLWDENSMNRSHMEYTFDNGSVFRFFPSDDAAKLKGRKNTITWFNEATEALHDDIFQLSMRTTHMMILDYNPDYSEDHWLVQKNADDDTHFFITTYLDNRFLEPRIIDQIEKLRFTNPSLWQMYGEGKRCKVEGLIYPNFEIIERFPQASEIRGLKIVAAVDYGYSVDPTAIVKVGMTRDAVYVEEICYERKMSNAKIAEKLKDQRIHRLRKISESSDPKTVDELISLGVLHLSKVNKGGQRSKSVRKASIHRLQAKKWYVTASSTNVQRELRNYCFQVDKNGDTIDEPIGMFDHAMDAIRYAEMTITQSLGRSSGIIIH